MIKNKKKVYASYIFFLFLYIVIGAIRVYPQVENKTVDKDLNNSLDNHAIEDLPLGFSGLELGSDIENIKDVLRKSTLFLYEEKIFEIPTSTGHQIITVEGRGFIDNAYLYFSDDTRLISLVIFLNTKHISYSTMYETLSKKYGRPELTVNEAKWSNGTISMFLEKPLSIKYILEDSIPSPDKEEELSLVEEARNKFMELF